MSSKEITARLLRRARQTRVNISADLAERLVAYYELLARWNQKINLTALGDPDEAIDRLLLEPLVAAKHVPDGEVGVIDIGSGGGSPAIPIKLACPSASLLMVESKVRKAAFLREAVRRLDLGRTHVETARYQELLSRPDLHEAMDIVTVRAVRVEPVVLTSLQAFLKPGGSIFLFRGPTGPEAPATLIAPPLLWEATYPLVESLRSRLTVLRKAPVPRTPGR